MKITKQQLKQIIKEELSEVINEIGVPFLSTGLKNPEMVNLVLKDSGDFYDGPFSRKEAEDIIATQDPRGELEIKPVTSRQADLSDFEDAYEQGASPEDIIAMINRQKRE